MVRMKEKTYLPKWLKGFAYPERNLKALKGKRKVTCEDR